MSIRPLNVLFIFCTILGWLYGKLMNAVKGAEMTIATYSGFSIVAFFNILWLAIPFSNRKMGWMLGNGLRETIQMDSFESELVLIEDRSPVYVGTCEYRSLAVHEKQPSVLRFFAFFCL